MDRRDSIGDATGGSGSEMKTRAAMGAQSPEREIPVLAQLLEDRTSLETRARRLADRLALSLKDRLAVRVCSMESAVGGGSLPELSLPSFGVAISGELSSDKLARGLRHARCPILARVHDDELCLDVRTLRDEDWDAVAEALADLLR